MFLLFSAGQEKLVLLQGDFVLLVPVLLDKLVLSVEHLVPDGEEGLGEVVAEPPVLVVDVVVNSVVGEDELEWVPRETVAAVVIHGLHGSEDIDKERLTRRELRYKPSNARSQRVEQEPFHGVVVQGTVRVWHIKSVVPRVESSVQGFVQVHGSMKPVLPSVDDTEGEAHPENRPAVHVGKPEGAVGHPRGSPVMLQVPDRIKLVARCRRRVNSVDSVSNHQLDHVLHHHVPEDVPERSFIPQLLLFRWVDSVLFCELVHVDDVEKG